MQHRRRMQNFQALLQHTIRRQLAEKNQQPQPAQPIESHYGQQRSLSKPQQQFISLQTMPFI